MSDFKRVEIRRAEVPAYGKGYIIYDLDHDEPAYRILYKSIPDARGVVNKYNEERPMFLGIPGIPQQEWGIVNTCEPWPAGEEIAS